MYLFSLFVLLTGQRVEWKVLEMTESRVRIEKILLFYKYFIEIYNFF